MDFCQTFVVINLDLDAGGEGNEGWAGRVDGEVLVGNDAPAWFDPVGGAGLGLKNLFVDVVGEFDVGFVVDIVGKGCGDALASE